ncbi:squalene/phytoene synthase family protein [Candidatus Pacearchaeota archaeon]|nr:squalene/phytoene synthase family protein [Candidatus Pacearchaeota archaeon]
MRTGQDIRKEIMRNAASGQKLSSEELLLLKSRSFSVPIGLLETFAGPNEHNKRPHVRNAYNWLRFADEIEDGTLPIGEKRATLDKTHLLVTEICRDYSQEHLDDLIQNKLERIVKTGVLGAVDKETRVFIKQFGNGPVVYELGDILRREGRNSEKIAGSFRDCFGTMVVGMKDSLDKEFVKEEDLLNYCYYVAGIVGDWLTNLTNTVDGTNLDVKLGRRLGRFLQLTNVAKNIREDQTMRERYSESRTLFLPSDFYRNSDSKKGFDAEDLFKANGANPDAKYVRENVFDNLSRLAFEEQEVARDYLESIPPRVSGYRAFCLVPYLAAVATWETMRNAGAEKVFKGSRDAITIPKTKLADIVQFVAENAGAYNLKKVLKIVS